MKDRLILLVLSAGMAHAATVENTGFESSIEGWRFWARDKEAGRIALDTTAAFEGKQSVRIVHLGGADWSFEPVPAVHVEAGDVLEFGIHVLVKGEGTVSLCASTWAGPGRVVEWSAGEHTATEGAGWQALKSRVLAAPGVSELHPRVIGSGPATVWLDAFELRKRERPAVANLPSKMTLTNRWLVLDLDTSSAALSVTDSRTARCWRQIPDGSIALLKAERSERQLRMSLLHASSGLELESTISLAADGPEFTIDLNGAGQLDSAVAWPYPFESRRGDRLIVPMNEGVSYPVEDETIPLHRLIAYGGHGICMAFWGQTDREAGHMAIIETPDDAAIRMMRTKGLLVIRPEWEAQRREFGYTRKLRYAFFDHGGHVAMAKRYRAYASGSGLLKTLEEKRRFNPNVDLLVGAVNVWCWDNDAVSIVKELQAAGIDRILWSNRQTPEKLRALNGLGVLTSRYDIYQDAMNPAEFPRLRWIHPDWTSAAWPNDIIIGSNGKWIKGWGVEAKDGSMVNCGVICDRRALDYARERVPAELQTHAYKCRFIDTTTAAPWHECYATNHPMTRSESKKFKMDLLRYMSQEMKLVTGTETGHDASVPFVHYYEGMLSLGPYRVPDSGRRMDVIWTNVPALVAKFQLGHEYRLPLWELVYHDCTVAQWYWGDYNNKLPALWDKRDLFNVLYGTPPMFMFERKLWAEKKARFVQSYTNTCPYVRQNGYSEMVDHCFLTGDRAVQQTRFANGNVITVNFAQKPYTMSDGMVVGSMSYRSQSGSR